MKNKRILIFGATGLLGEPVARELREQGFTVRVFARSEEKFRDRFGKEFELATGDVMDTVSIDHAMRECDAVHISLSNIDDRIAAKHITAMAAKHHIGLISLVTGSTVSQMNTWFWMTKQKYEAEQVLIGSGIPYLIFRPSWFYDTLPRMVRKGKAMVIGRQEKTFHWIAASDFASMVVNAFKNEEMVNRSFYCFGPEVHTVKGALEKYCRLAHPGIRKVSEAPVWLMKLIAVLTGNRLLKMFTALSVYFTKVDEPPVDQEVYRILGRPVMTMEDWVKSATGKS